MSGITNASFSTANNTDPTNVSVALASTIELDHGDIQLAYVDVALSADFLVETAPMDVSFMRHALRWIGDSANGDENAKYMGAYGERSPGDSLNDALDELKLEMIALLDNDVSFVAYSGTENTVGDYYSDHTTQFGNAGTAFENHVLGSVAKEVMGNSKLIQPINNGGAIRGASNGAAVAGALNTKLDDETADVCDGQAILDQFINWDRTVNIENGSAADSRFIGLSEVTDGYSSSYLVAQGGNPIPFIEGDSFLFKVRFSKNSDGSTSNNTSSYGTDVAADANNVEPDTLPDPATPANCSPRSWLIRVPLAYGVAARAGNKTVLPFSSVASTAV